jgi:hypothetical protein
VQKGIADEHGWKDGAMSALTQVMIEIEQHAARAGWEQPARLYALVETADLLQEEPRLAGALGVEPDAVRPGMLTPVEQEELPADRPLDQVLAGIAWPPRVLGCALVVERLMLPPEAEASLPDEGDVTEWVASHPDRQEVRIAVGVLRDGTRDAAVRLRNHDEDTSVLSGPELVPGLADALAATLED